MFKVKELEKAPKYDGHTPSDAIKRIGNLTCAGYRKQSEWISVDERLPESEGDFLVWNKEQKRTEIRFFYRLPPNYPVESHPEIREYFGNFKDYKRITHWMPLPEAPKMKGGGE
jgi:hypothetical protein